MTDQLAETFGPGAALVREITDLIAENRPALEEALHQCELTGEPVVASGTLHTCAARRALEARLRHLLCLDPSCNPLPPADLKCPVPLCWSTHLDQIRQSQQEREDT
ncbi:MAG: hypothetical protein Alpg2KO_01200 [Alphaproteobacteria bacterium]